VADAARAFLAAWERAEDSGERCSTTQEHQAAERLREVLGG